MSAIFTDAARARAWPALVIFFCGSPFAASATGTARPATTRTRRSLLTAGSSYRRGLGRVCQVGPHPALGLLERDPLAAGVVLELISPDPADREVARLRVGEVQP